MASRQIRGWFVCAAAVGALALYGAQAQAAAITGDLNIANVTGSGVSVNSTTIDWNDPPVGPPSGTFSVGGGLTGSFAGLTGNGTILDLNTTNEPAGSPFVLGGPVAGDKVVNLPGEGNVLAGFLTFVNAPNIVFDLSVIDVGFDPSTDCSLAPALGQTCTIPTGTSPFNFQNTSPLGSSSVSFDVSGFVRNTLDGSLSTFTGGYTTQFQGPNQSFQQLIAIIEGGGTVSNTYSGDFVATVTAIPEPVTMMTFGTGVALIARRLRRRRTV